MDQRIIDHKEHERKLEKIKVCGANRGPHNYIPVIWVKSNDEEHVSMIMCMNCFTRVKIKTLYEHFEEAVM